MSLRLTITAVLLLVSLASQALAFQEQRQGTPAGSQVPAADFAVPSPAPQASGPGTEVRVPGLGKLGNLPRMDFGLELLYGANDGKQAPVAPVQREEQIRDDDLTIRGTVKHKF